MRVLYLHQYFTTPQHSGGTRSYEFARRLVAQGHDVRLLTTSAFLDPTWAPASGWHRRELEGIRLEVLRSTYSNRMAYRGRMGEFLRFAFAATLRACSEPADVVIASSTPLTIAIPGVLAAKRLRAPLVFEVRDLWPEVPVELGALRNPLAQKAAYALADWAYAHADQVIALSPGMKDGIVGRGVAEEAVTVITNGADLALFDVPEERITQVRSRHAWWGQRRVALYAGTLGVVNDAVVLATYAKAARQVDGELRFVVIGDGAERAALMTRSAELGVLNETLFVLDPMPKSEVAAYVAAADVALSTVSPARVLWSNSANKVFDAMAAGTAIAINHRGWLAELLESSGAGFVLPAEDPFTAGQELARIMADGEQVQRASARARDLARTEFDRDVLAARFEAVLARAVEQRRSR